MNSIKYLITKQIILK